MHSLLTLDEVADVAAALAAAVDRTDATPAPAR
jgi:hypothetical protein